MEQSNANTSGARTVISPRVPFAELVSPVQPFDIRSAAILKRAGAFVIRAYLGLRKQHAVNRTIRELQKLDDRLLNDIGISKSQIVPVAYALGNRYELEN